MYTCGPTVYDFSHIGNFRALLTYDLIKRVLLYFGYDVMHICNLTDVDDKIIARANEQGIDKIADLTSKYETAFLQDLESLNCILATAYPKATDHIPDMMAMITELAQNGLAYESADGSWWYRTSQKKGYGQQLVQNLNVEDMEATERGESEYKEQPQDFCLWKGFKPGIDREDLAWSSSDGTFLKGRPGWHLECSAMARKFLGDTIDLHGGGIDLKFPHHENEIAQSEGATGKPFCNCWIHNGFVNIGSDKMSKSLNNFLTLRSACPTAQDVRAYRYLVMSSQYRTALTFTPQAMQAAKNALQRIDKVKQQIQDHQQLNHDGDLHPKDSILVSEVVPQALVNFEAALKDDLSMPRASAALFSLVKAAEQELKQPKDAIDTIGLEAIGQALDQMDRVFGIFYEVPHYATTDDTTTSSSSTEIPDDVLQLVQQRTAAKEQQDWELADSLRARIAELGYSVKDVKGGEPLVSKCD
jgi:cysteinyl-tRNA synthetase